MAVTNTPGTREKLAICERLVALADDLNLPLGNERRLELREDADTIEALVEALEELVDGYRSEADPYSCGGFCRNLDEDDCMVTALAALSRARNGGQP